MVATPGIQMSSPSGAALEHPLSERYEGLIRVAQAIGAHRDPKDLFRAMASELHRVIQFDGIVVTQYDEASNEIRWNACEVCSQQGPASPPEIPADETIAKWVYVRQEPLVIPALDRETRFPHMIAFLRAKGFQSVCALPLTTAHRRIGSLAVASKRADAYCAEETRFLSLVADQVALAIDDALNFEASQSAQSALQHKNDRLKLLLELNNTIASTLDLRELLRAISASVRPVMQCDGVGVALPDGDNQQLRIYACDFPSSNGSMGEEILIPANENSAGARAFQSGEPVSVLCCGPDGIDPLAAAAGVKSLCHIPLISRNRTLGLLSLARLALVPFSPKDLEFLTLVANQVAIAVENALAYREIAELKDRLAQEKVYLEDEIRSELNFEEIVAWPGQASGTTITESTAGASVAFARYTASVEQASPWESEAVEIEASLPKLAKAGRLRAIRRLLPLGRPEYQVLEIAGDRTVREQVIVRYLSADVRAAAIPASSVAITAANYRFHYKGPVSTGEGLAYAFLITPRKKREGLIKGELWLDAETGAAVRQSGCLVKRPSVFVRRLDITREIVRRRGLAEMRVTHLSIDTRLVGHAELTIVERPWAASDPEIAER